MAATINIGFTGTHHGMTEAQLAVVIQILEAHEPKEFHHGGCVGADAQAAIAAYERGWRVVLHPPEEKKAMWHQAVRYAHFIHPAKPYLDRNHDIVDVCGKLLAGPSGFEMVLRSGTWATVRYARNSQTPVTIIYPSGEFSEEGYA